MSDLDDAFEEFKLAQAGATAHLDTMAQAARDAAELMLLDAGERTGEARLLAQRFTRVAEQCAALDLLISMLELPPSEGGA